MIRHTASTASDGTAGVPPQREKLPLIWFDKLLRRAGLLLLAPVLLLRWYATLLFQSQYLQETLQLSRSEERPAEHTAMHAVTKLAALPFSWPTTSMTSDAPA